MGFLVIGAGGDPHRAGVAALLYWILAKLECISERLEQ